MAEGRPDATQSALREDLDALVSIDPDLCFDLANDLTALGHTAAAIPFYEAAIRAGVAEAPYNLGLLHLDTGATESALRCFRQAAEVGDPKGALMLAQALEDSGELAEAREFHSRAKSLPGASMRLARVLRELGDDEGALSELRGSAGESWESAVDYALSGELDDDAAIQLLEGFIARGEHGVAVTLANFYDEAGRTDDAVRVLGPAAREGDLHALTYLGTILHARGDAVAAQEHWRSAKERGDELAARLLERHVGTPSPRRTP
ncbi:tetratricopeptide repeat protein [Oerskovia flava]|uniref:tetratricopeptide repeat protein n=1 Tax=Oerskovia flava TaxID=2986422 RepID=UPI00223FACF5|nr:tetratricopeptide repeat protein [Oerskovia sp. JB1-3-2]